MFYKVKICVLSISMLHIQKTIILELKTIIKFKMNHKIFFNNPLSILIHISHAYIIT